MDGSRELHVTFVSNLNGSYPLDTVLATLPAPLSVALTSVVLTFLLPARYVLLQYSSRLWIHLLIESMTVVCPLLLSFTVLSHSTAYNPIILLVTIAGLMMCAFKRWTSNIPLTEHLFSLSLSEKRPPFLTNYRAGMNLATAICILAVDFPIFPRRFAKTETYGYSLMDVGVGSFVIAHGLIGSGQIHTARTLSRTLPIAILGFVRLIAVKMTNYHEHVTEYGVHWNFFFTLAFVKIVSSLIVTNTRPIIMSLGYLSVYQIGLKLGLESWILSEYPRHDLISANREGIFSLFGYMALFYAACELGDYINKPKQQFRDWFRLLLVLVSLSILAWFSLPLSESMFGMPSRRLVNATFCLWMVSFGNQLRKYKLV